MNGLQAERYGYRHSNEGGHMSFIAVVGAAEIRGYASEMAGAGIWQSNGKPSRK